MKGTDSYSEFLLTKVQLLCPRKLLISQKSDLFLSCFDVVIRRCLDFVCTVRETSTTWYFLKKKTNLNLMLPEGIGCSPSITVGS